MTGLKLPKLPDRTPVKLTVSIGSELYLALKDYAARYETAYGVAETVVDLIPFMLDAFIKSDGSVGKKHRR